jgi:hypothetical protein
MISQERKSQFPKTDVPLLKIPDLCIGSLTGPVGNISKTHRNQNKRGTEHINIRLKSHTDSFLAL